MTNKDLNLALDQNLIQPCRNTTKQYSRTVLNTPTTKLPIFDTTMSPGADSSNNYQRQHNRYNKTPSSFCSNMARQATHLPLASLWAHCDQPSISLIGWLMAFEP